jgi:hypothetical protein
MQPVTAGFIRLGMIARLALAILLGVLTTLLVPRVMRWTSRSGVLPAPESGVAAGLGGQFTRELEPDLTSYTWEGAPGVAGSQASIDDIVSAARSASYLDPRTSGSTALAQAGLPPPIAPTDPRVQVLIVEQGFPWRCTWGWQRQSFAPSAVAPGGVILRTRPRVRSYGFVYVGPFRLTWAPMWEGLAANTALYGGIWFVFMSLRSRKAGAAAQAPAASQRRICSACGSSLKGVPAGARCPACGVAR